MWKMLYKAGLKGLESCLCSHLNHIHLLHHQDYHRHHQGGPEDSTERYPKRWSTVEMVSLQSVWKKEDFCFLAARKILHEE